MVLKPPPVNVQEIYLESLTAIGIDLRQHDLKFEEENWEAPTLGAWGIGWQMMLDGQEITQFTYFQQCGGLDLDPISAEITYGLERIASFCKTSTPSTTWFGRERLIQSPTPRSGISRRCSSRSTPLRRPMWRSCGNTCGSTKRSASNC